MTEPFNTELYDQRIDAMKARERADSERIAFRQYLQDSQCLWQPSPSNNAERLAAYKRKRAEMDELCLSRETVEQLRAEITDGQRTHMADYRTSLLRRARRK